MKESRCSISARLQCLCPCHDQEDFFLTFKRNPRLPIDLALNLPDLQPKRTRQRYVDKLQERLKNVYKAAAEEAGKQTTDQKRGYERRARAGVLQVSDRVLVKLLAFDGKHKIADKYEEYPYIVVEQQDSSVPVYIVRRKHGQGRKKVLHRRKKVLHLLPISDLPIPTRAEDEEKPKDSTRLKTPTPTPSLKSDAQERVFELGGEENDDQVELILMQEPDFFINMIYFT